MIPADNGLNPVWNEQCEFDIVNPELAMIRLVVQDEDMFGEPNFLGQATYPVRGLKPGMIFISLWTMSNLMYICQG